MLTTRILHESILMSQSYLDHPEDAAYPVEFLCALAWHMKHMGHTIEVAWVAEITQTPSALKDQTEYTAQNVWCAAVWSQCDFDGFGMGVLERFESENYAQSSMEVKTYQLVPTEITEIMDQTGGVNSSITSSWQRALSVAFEKQGIISYSSGKTQRAF